MTTHALAAQFRIGTPALAAPRPGLVAAGLAAAVTAMALVACLLVPWVPSGHGGGDFLAMLDGGYRIASGQTPHVDFAVPHGPWPLVQGWIALALEPWSRAFLTYQATEWLTVLPAALVLGARQRGALAAAAVVGFAALATLLPYVVELEKVPDFAWYAGYNRLVTALLFLVAVWAVTPTRPGRGLAGWGDAALLAYLLAMLAATKVTGAAAAGGLVLVAALVSAPRRRTLVRALALLAVAAVLLQAATGVPLAYLGNVLEMVALNRGSGLFFLGLVGLRALPACLALAWLAWLVRARPAPEGRPALRGISDPRRLLARLRRDRAALLVAAVGACALFAESQNNGNLGLAAAAALLALPLAGPARRRPAVAAARAALAVAVLAPWLGGAAVRGATLLTASYRDFQVDPAMAWILPGTRVSRFNGEVADDYLRHWRAGEGRGGEGGRPSALLEAAKSLEPGAFVADVRAVHAAAEAARRAGLVGPDSRVMTIGHIDWFARALGARPVPGTHLWHAPARTFAPPPEGYRHYLRNVDAAFRDLCVAPGPLADQEPFLPALEADFVRHAVTPCWELWLRRS
jgi:hypothetical protein